MKLRMLHDLVLLQPDTPDKVTQGGIVLPDSAQRQDPIAVVVSVGPGRQLDNGTLIPMDLKEGDRCVVNKISATIDLPKCESMIVARRCDILAVIDE